MVKKILEVMQSVFDLLKRRNTEVELTEAQIKWNKMWTLWAEEGIESPYGELMEYVGEVNNGGHSQYFSNVENIGDLEKAVLALYSILPVKLKDNLENAYKAYGKSEEAEFEEEADAIMQECDTVFRENEQVILDILQAYADKMEDVV